MEGQGRRILTTLVRCGVQENRTMGGLKCSEEGIIIRLTMLMIIMMMIIILRI